ncbi:MAG TPA: carboxypeptidase regulatory-like domain-containing protein [Thermoanaerobaculia bacterium]|nr:carboxypeptidase regulatory-like domain-containing protein [Thermoanaerobaculia bacterium]
MRTMLCGVLAAIGFAVTPGYASITGTVMNADGAPVAGARVSLSAYETLEARRARLLSAAPEPATLASTQTDAKGAFKLDSPKEPVVALHIVASGYAPESGRIERDEEVGAVILHKGPAGRGVITSAGGKPVANATVAIQYGMYELVTKTNAEGRYEAPNPKRVTGLAVIHPDHAIEEKSLFRQLTERDLTIALTAGVKLTGRVTGSDGRTPAAGAAILIDSWPMGKSGEDGAFTIEHAPARWTTLAARSGGLMAQVPFAAAVDYTLRLARAATVSGRVLDAKTKEPVAGAIVRLTAQRSNRDALAAETDAKGTYSIAAPQGSFLLYTWHPGYDPANADVFIEAGQQVARDLAVPRLARVSGTILDEEKRPVVAADVASVPVDSSMGDGPGRMMRARDTVVSGPDGRFSAHVTSEEPLQIVATKRGFPRARSERLRLGPGERKAGLVLTIPSGIAVSGRVTDGKGEPLAGVAVVPAESRDGDDFMMFAAMQGRSEDVVLTGADGSFTIHVEEGTYDFHFQREGYTPKAVRAQSVSHLATPSVETTLEPAVEISGRVVRGGTGVAGVNLHVFSSGINASAVTGPDGSFTLSGLAPGSMRVRLWKADDFIQDTRSLTAPGRDVTVEIPGGGRVTGRVVDKSTGKPLTSFQAGVASSQDGMMGGPPQLREISSEDGSFTLESVPAGALSLVAGAHGYASTRLNVTIEEGKTLSGVELSLDAGVRLTGRVTGPDGAALADVSVRVEPSRTRPFLAWGPESTSITDANGEYALEALAPGEETIAFTHAAHAGSRKQVTLKGRETRLDVQLSAGQRVTGVVVTEAGAPVPGAEVNVWGPGMRGGAATTNAGGVFEMEALPPGRYRFSAVKRGTGRGTVEDVDVAKNEQVRITIREGATIHGRVIGLSPQELAAARVQAYGASGFATANVDAAGSYRLEGAPTGTVRVRAEVDSSDAVWQRTSQVQTVEVAPGGSQSVDLTFRTDIVIRGRVVRDGRPLQSASVTFEPRHEKGTQTFASATTDEQGLYSLTGVEEGEYTVEVLDVQRATPYSTAYTVRASATFDIDYRTSAVRGTVLDAETSEPLANASVQIRAATQNQSFQMPRGATTDAAGTFVLESVPPGPYVVTIAKDGFGSDVREVAVGERGEELQVKLPRSEAVTLKAIDARSGQPVTGWIWVYDAQNRVVYEPSFPFGRGSESGEVKLPLAPGSYTAVVTASGYAPVNLRLQAPSPARMVALTPGGTILVKSKHAERRRIRLLDADGLPYGRFGNLLPWRELLPRPGTTEWRSIAPGTYTLQLLGDGDAVVDSTRVTVPEGGVAEAEL